LIARIAQGDRLAMQVLYRRHHVRVFRFGLRLVRDDQVAEDLVSEVLLDVWRQAGKFEGRSAVSTWLLAITRFKALSAIRRRKDCELEDEAANALADTCDDPEAAATRKDTGKALRKCRLIIARSSISSTTTRSLWKKWLKSRGFPRTL
jgi:RNA polymerase sigma-70 factor, ECF subfamily